MEQKQVWIDKTGAAEEMLETSRGLCLCGMPGLGRKQWCGCCWSVIRKLYPCAGSLDQLRPPEERQEKKAVWYLVRGLSFRDLSRAGRTAAADIFPDGGPGSDYICDGRGNPGGIAGICMEWKSESGVSGLFLVYPGGNRTVFKRVQKPSEPGEYLSSYQRLAGASGPSGPGSSGSCRSAGSRKNCAPGSKSGQFIRGEILGSISEEERDVMVQRACFPRLNRELEQLLWKDPRQETEEKLFMRGILFYQPGKSSWYVHPAIRLLLGKKLPLNSTEPPLSGMSGRA